MHNAGFHPETLVREIKQICRTKALDDKKRRRASRNQRRNARHKQARMYSNSCAKSKDNAKTETRPIGSALGKHKKVIWSRSNPNDKRGNEKFKHYSLLKKASTSRSARSFCNASSSSSVIAV